MISTFLKLYKLENKSDKMQGIPTRQGIRRYDEKYT